MVRLLPTGSGGQARLSAATQELVRESLPEGADLRDLGEHRLKDLGRPETVFPAGRPVPAGSSEHYAAPISGTGSVVLAGGGWMLTFLSPCLVRPSITLLGGVLEQEARWECALVVAGSILAIAANRLGRDLPTRRARIGVLVSSAATGSANFWVSKMMVAALQNVNALGIRFF